MSLFWWLVGLIVAGGVIFYLVMFRGDVGGEMDEHELRTAVDHEFAEELNDVEQGELEMGPGRTPNLAGEYEDEDDQLDDAGLARGLRNDAGELEHEFEPEDDETIAPSLRAETESEKLMEYDDEDEYDQLDDEGIARGLKSDVGNVDDKYKHEHNVELEPELEGRVGEFEDDFDEEEEGLHLTEAAVRARLIDEGFQSGEVDDFSKIYGKRDEDDEF